jgi:hypothetical protein
MSAFGVKRIGHGFPSATPIKSGTFCKVSSQQTELGRLWEDPRGVKSGGSLGGLRSGQSAYVGKAGPPVVTSLFRSLFWGRQNLPSLCDLLHIWHLPLLLVCKHANRGNRLLGTGIGSRWHADDRNLDLDCCSGSPGQPVDQIGIGKAPAPAHVQHRGDSVSR